MISGVKGDILWWAEYANLIMTISDGQILQPDRNLAVHLYRISQVSDQKEPRDVAGHTYRF